MNKIKIFIADDHPIVYAGLKNIFSDEKNFEISGTASNINDAIDGISKCSPHLLITDLNFNGINSGLDFIRSAKKRYPELKILAISMLDEDVYAERAAKAGASGYVMKSELTGKIVSAVREVMRDRVFFNPSILSKIVGTLQGKPETVNENPESFSNRELQVFELLAAGSSAKEISDKLTLSPKTIDTYKSRLREKLNLETNSELVKYAIKWFQDGPK